MGPKYQTPVAEVPAAYKEAAGWKTAQPNDQNLGGNWWEMFQDPQLNALEQQVERLQPELESGRSPIYPGSRVAPLLPGRLLPHRDGRSVGYSHTDFCPSSASGTTFNGITYNDFVLPFNLSYELDVWGRVRRTVESYREQAQASAADLATVNLSMHADLAIDYFPGPQPGRRGTAP